VRHVRYQEPSGSVRIAIEQPGVEGSQRLQFMEANESDFVGGVTGGFTPAYRSVTADPEILQLDGDLRLIAPLDAPELWCANLTYPASRQARLREAVDAEAYHQLAKERYPTFHLKDAGGHRTVGQGEPLAIRSDATWVVPEPEIGVVLGERGKIVGYTIVNDVCCRDIRGANPLFLTRATTYRNSCAIGPAILVEPGRRKPFTIYLRISDADGTELVAQKTTTKEMQLTFRQLVDWLIRDNPLPPGTIVATGAAIVPPESFSLQPGQVVEIHVPEIGTLSNPVVLVADLEENEMAERRRAAQLARLLD
jgi:2-dehydro-3-deoxy-D-arabinonate dehydratase